MTGYGVPPASSPAPQRSGQPALPLFDLIGAGLGVLTFIWGFLPWYKGSISGAGDTKGYAVASPGAAVIGLSLLASAVAAAPLLDKAAKSTLVPAGAAISALLVSFGLLVGKGDGIDTKIGLILALITVLAQAVLFVLSFLQSSGRTNAPRPSVAAPQWGGPAPTQQYGGYQPGAPSGYGQQPPSYSPPQQVPHAPHQPQAPQYNPPQQPQSPPQQPGYGQPQPPQQPGYGQPPSNPYGQ